MSRIMALAMAGRALVHGGDHAFAISILLAFHGLLRPGELFGLRKYHFVFNSNGTSLVMALGYTKGGIRKGTMEYVVIDCALTVAVTAYFLHDKPGDFLVCNATSTQWRRRFDEATAALALQDLSLRPYSLRRGGATCLFNETSSLALCMERGRWRHSAAAQLYLVQGAAELQQMTLTPAARQALQRHAAVWGV